MAAGLCALDDRGHSLHLPAVAAIIALAPFDHNSQASNVSFLVAWLRQRFSTNYNSPRVTGSILIQQVGG